MKLFLSKRTLQICAGCMGILAVLWLLTPIATIKFTGGGVMPPKVTLAAWRFALTHPYSIEDSPGVGIGRAYSTWFVDGFTCGKSCGVENVTALEADAYRNGVTYRREHPEMFDKIMSGFGYRRVEADGKWSVGLERNSFVSAAFPGEIFTITEDGASNYWKKIKDGELFPTGELPVHIVGYLSPQPEHSTAGQHRDVLVVSIIDLTEAPRMSPP